MSTHNNAMPLVALMGNPNSGKTAVFNLLTGLNQKVSNYPGVTVEQKLGNGILTNGKKIQYLDLPGTYSITPESFDEQVVTKLVYQWMHGDNMPDAIIAILDASNLNRNLYLALQLMELGIPVILALNMMDVAKRKNNEPDITMLNNMFPSAKVVQMSATEKWGIPHLKNALGEIFDTGTIIPTPSELPIPENVKNILNPLINIFKSDFGYSDNLAVMQALRITVNNHSMEIYKSPHINFKNISSEVLEKLLQIRNKCYDKLLKADISMESLEPEIRYKWLDENTRQDSQINKIELHNVSKSEKVDEILTHKYLGPIIFIGLLYFIFQSIFLWATIPMDWIDLGITKFSDFVITLLNPGILRELITEGIIGGVGAILIFLPQIIILVFFLTILEDSGYMSRVAFMMDKMMHSMGMHGKSVFPLMSGYACAIPGIMAARTIDNWKERLVTILVLPLMSCSARLPVYTLLIGAFVPPITVLGILGLQGLIMISMYFIGTATAFILAMIFSRFIKTKDHSTFIMELPPFRIPILKSVIRQVYNRGKMFVVDAGKIILAISILLWFLASFPKNDPQSNINSIESSYAGKIGHFIEPAIEPLGFDWKIGVGLITSFAAREVVISTLATIYNVESNNDGRVNLTLAIQNDLNQKTGKNRYNILTALSLMVFYVYAAQCMATFAMVKQETNSWKWPVFMIVYMTILAYGMSFIVYQTGLYLGLV